jgi:hypothetical protein
MTAGTLGFSLTSATVCAFFGTFLGFGNTVRALCLVVAFVAGTVGLDFVDVSQNLSGWLILLSNLL